MPGPSVPAGKFGVRAINGNANATIVPKMIERLIVEIISIMKRLPVSGHVVELFRQTRFADLAEHVKNELVRFLNSRSRIAFHDKIDIGNASRGSAIASEKCDCF